MKKTVLKAFRITESQDKFLKEQCEIYGISESEYLRSLLMPSTSKQERKTREEYLTKKALITEINYIGNNINQIVKNVNMNYYNAYEKKKLFAMMEAIKKKVMEL